ncbi:D-alanine--D-alanine ligase [Mumia sp. ZJ1417]|uniref:D-alanine--D-alanine ligase family protein n=1 Tax=unclassified Mumia TaxID=2621872 RepID=UPI00142220B4|nr:MULTISPECIES: D-alanine--D-alanine ligase family protein [unclassified Mumia]QMW67619.1 D-alanine--D-alanine ligase [Mumia sp. ZJ1417]
MSDPRLYDPAHSGTASHDGRPCVLLVFGGRSSEHEVSCMTTREVLAVVDRERYDVVAVGITRDGRWLLQEHGVSAAAGTLPVVDESGTPVSLAGSRLLAATTDGGTRVVADIDVAFPLLHGPWGEDGTIQGLFEMAGLRYVGSGVLASAVAMDKAVAKVVFAAAGLPQLPYTVVHPDEWADDPAAVRESVASLHYPVFVKPARAGSSMGGTLVADEHALAEAIAVAQEHDPKVIVESAVEAREIECGVLQNPDGSVSVSPPGEIAVDHGAGHAFYDFDAKYVDGTSKNLIPARLDGADTERVCAKAARAFGALGCEGLARVDFFFVDDVLYINEVNTMPGFTPFSMFPQVWQAAGVEYAELVERLLAHALARSTGLR